MRKALSNRPIHVDFAILVLRVGLGVTMFGLRGLDKLKAGPDMWTQLGGAMGNVGIHFAPTFWGFMAAFAEGVCALLVVLGLFFRPATLLLAFTMFMAGLAHLNMPPESPSAGWRYAAHGFELMFAYLALFLAGAGRFSVKLWRDED